MFITYKGKNKEYAYVKESKRIESTVKTEATYLGKVADRQLGVFFTPQRGFFTYDVQSRQYGEPPSDFVYPLDGAKNRAIPFGGSFLLNAFLHKTGMVELIDSLPFGNKHTLRSMVLFYILSPLANKYAERWYQSGLARLLYPKANLASQRISEMLATIGSEDSVQNYLEKQLAWVLEHLNPDRNILIDSTALENSIKIPLSRPGIQNGAVKVAIRFIAVVQKGGIPLFFKSVSGNTVDVSTLSFTLETMKAMKVEIESCIIDAGYNCASNLDLFYDEDCNCNIDYISRVKSNDLELKSMINDEIDSLEDRENFYNYNGRFVFIKKKKIFVGKNKDKHAWLYLGKDVERTADEIKSLSKKAEKKKLTDDEVYELTQKGGIFALVSGMEYPCEEILPRYYQRQAAEQLFDFLKNYTKILPLRVWTEETVRGHLLLSFIAATVVTLLHIKMKSKDLSTWETLKALELLGSTRYQGKLVVDPLEKTENDIFKALDIECPYSLPITGDKLCFTPPDAVDQPLKEVTQFEKSDGDASVEAEFSDSKQKRSRGRPKGSKNKKTVERETQAAAADSTPKRGRGRPKGSKNKKTLEREAQAAVADSTPKRGRGRPKGSKNKKTLEREAQAAVTAEGQDMNPC